MHVAPRFSPYHTDYCVPSDSQEPYGLFINNQNLQGGSKITQTFLYISYKLLEGGSKKKKTKKGTEAPPLFPTARYLDSIKNTLKPSDLYQCCMD